MVDKIIIAAVTVLYNPDKKFTDNIYSYLNQVDLLILVDNSENPNPAFYTGLQNNSKIRWVSYNENKGIAKALNDAAAVALENKADWLLTMDQDSWFEKHMIENYLLIFKNLPGKNTIAVVGPVFEHGIKTEKAENIAQVTSLITSGSLVNLSLFNQIGGYNENLFIDEVDHEYCYRAKLKGFSILEVRQIFLHHELGKKMLTNIFSGNKKTIRVLHAPIRLYYIVRNAAFVIATYKKDFPKEMKEKQKDVLVRIKNNILYGTKKLAICKFIIYGFIDYKRKKYGKYK